MSYMKRYEDLMSNLKSKKEYGLQKKEFDKKLDKIVSDEKSTLDDKFESAKTMGQLKLEGTKELNKKMSILADNMNQSLNNKIEKLSGNHDLISNRIESVKNEIDHSNSSVISDSADLKKVSSKINDADAKNEIQNAANIAKEDSKWLLDLSKSYSKNREESSGRNKELIRKVKNTKIGLRKGGDFKANDTRIEPRKNPNERIEEDIKGNRLKKYKRSDNHFTISLKHVKVQEYGIPHKDQQKELDHIPKRIRAFFENLDK